MSDVDGLAETDMHDVMSDDGTSGGDRRKTVVFVAPPGRISHALTCAIEAEFPWLSVVTAGSPAQICKRPHPEAQLIVVAYRTHCKDKGALAEIARAHGRAGLALMVETANDLSLEDLTGSLPLRGVLPMDVNLDILLSILRIMLHGGSYLAPAFALSGQAGGPVSGALAFADRAARGEEAPSATSVRRAGPGRPPAKPGSPLSGLTARECEVLQLVSLGCQNKIIASELKLSENTVKIHLHNIIRKLAVKNRTQAAALYLVDANGKAGTPSRAPAYTAGPS